jgi:hypothetical protein
MERGWHGHAPHVLPITKGGALPPIACRLLRRRGWRNAHAHTITTPPNTPRKGSVKWGYPVANGVSSRQLTAH